MALLKLTRWTVLKKHKCILIIKYMGGLVQYCSISNASLQGGYLIVLCKGLTRTVANWIILQICTWFCKAVNMSKNIDKIAYLSLVNLISVLLHFRTWNSQKNSWYNKILVIKSKSSDTNQIPLYCRTATWIWVNIGSGNGLLPDGTKPLPEPMLTHNQ